MEAATPAESARTEDPGLSKAREAAEVLPAESVRCNENQHPAFTTLTIFTHSKIPTTQLSMLWGFKVMNYLEDLTGSSEINSTWFQSKLPE